MRQRTVVSVAMVITFAAVCLSGLGLIALNMGLHGPWSNDFALKAEFASANGLVPQAEVRVSGVHVGSVLATFGGTARFTGLDVRDGRSRGANVFEIEDGKVRKLTLYWNRERALDHLARAG